MKRKLLSALCLCVTLFACTKENDAPKPADTEKKSVLKISVTDFIKTVQALPSPFARQASAASTLRDSSLVNISDIYYFIFDDNANVISYKHQSSLESNFGTISDSLRPGTYRMAISATAAPVNVNTSFAYFTIPASNNTVTSAFPDIFYHGQDITVAKDSANLVTPVLKRIMGHLEVNIQDMIDSDSANVSVRYDDGSINLYSGTSGLEPSIFGPLPLQRRSLTTFSDFIASTNSNTAIAIDIQYAERVTHRMVTKTITTQMYKNTKTVISGKLFQPVTVPDKENNNSNVGVDTKWSDSVRVINF
jgi:hypothetical protein